MRQDENMEKGKEKNEDITNGQNTEDAGMKCFLQGLWNQKKAKTQLVYPAIGIIFLVIMYFLFVPSGTDKDKKKAGINYNIPMPIESGLVSDKKAAYEQALIEQNRKERSRSIRDLSSMLQRGGNVSDSVEISIEDTEREKLYESRIGEDEDYANEYNKWSSRNGVKSGSDNPGKAIQSSAGAYQSVNSTLQSFYSDSASVAAMADDTMSQNTEPNESQVVQPHVMSTSDQIALMEKSYELAAKYMPGGNKDSVNKKEEKREVVPVRQVNKRVVSSLSQQMTDSAFMAMYLEDRNMGFNTPVGRVQSVSKNTISACVYEDQAVTDGQCVKLRLLEPLQVSDAIIPLNSILVGIAKIQGERLNVKVASVECEGSIYPVLLTAYDMDGLSGMFIPGSMEINSVREVASNMGQNMGTSISVTQSAGQQIASDLSKGVIQGASQYLSKKLRTVKVHLKAGYRVMLLVGEE